MPRFSLQAESVTAGYTVNRYTTADGGDAVYKNLAEATKAAELWVATLNAEQYSESTDWVAKVAKS
jgi:hypothetical protein